LFRNSLRYDSFYSSSLRSKVTCVTLWPLIPLF
jgi:hypothetical protein